MTRRKIGSRRRGRDSFVDDKTDAALSSVTQLTETVRTKILRPIGAKPLLPPHLVRNADLDPYVYEGIPWINRGRGIIDPTPGNFQPLNRRLRREAQAELGTPKRMSAMRPSPLMTMSHADGPMAAMYSSRIFSRPENIMLMDEIFASVEEVETRVDAVLGTKPKTLRDATDSLKRLENLVNSRESGSSNFKLDIPYFASQMQPELSAVSPRFSGDSTPMSSYDYGVYYGVAANVLEYPEAFRDVHLLVAATNPPDEATESDHAGGRSAALPTYYLISQDSRNERQTRLAGLSMPQEAVSGAKDMSQFAMDILGGRVTSGARIPIAIMLPIYKSEGQKGALMRLIPSGMLNLSLQVLRQDPNKAYGKIANPPGDMMEMKKQLLDFWQNVLDQTGETTQPLLDSVAMSVIVGGIQEMEDLEGKIAQMRSANSQVPNENALQSIRSLEQRMAEVYSHTNKAASLVVTTHEFGHGLDFIGDYKNSPGYKQAMSKASTGINSQYEEDRDLYTLASLRLGMDHPIRDDLSEMVSRDFVKSTVLEMIRAKSELGDFPIALAIANDIKDELSELDPLIDSILTAGIGDSDRQRLVNLYYKGFADDSQHGPAVSPKRLEKTTGEIINSGIIRRDLLYQPEKLLRTAQEAMDRLRQIGEKSIASITKLSDMDQYRFYTESIEPMIKGAYKKIDRLPKPAQRAVALVSAVVAAHSKHTNGLYAYISNSRNAYADAQNKIKGFDYANDWFVNNVTQEMIKQVNIDGGRILMTNLISENPAVVKEFMEVYGRHHNRPWFDQNGAFSPTEYLKDATSNDTTMLAQVVNRWYAVQGSNGWKNLTDDEIRLVQSAVSKITDYAGPADYDNHNFLPKFQLASNSETYAELHPVMLMKMEKFMRKLNEKERRAVERLHAEMIAWARSVMNRTSAGG